MSDDRHDPLIAFATFAPKRSRLKAITSYAG
jgi:hypothetical protein